MSVNYSSHPQPFAVDVPVTDIDDPDDDVLFQEQTNQTKVVRTDDNHDFLDNLDYEFEDSSSKNFISKIAGFFKSRSKIGGNSYEMLNRENTESEDFEIDSQDNDDDQQYRTFDIRDYQIKLLSNKLKVTTVLGSVLLASLIAVIFHLIGRNHKNVYVNSYNKRIISNSTHDFHPTTLVISLDGFHPHYINPKITPTMHTLLMDGHGAPFMIPSFPSSTFPNHWTLVTGLDPADHGIVGNTFYDPILKKQFVNTDPKRGGLDPDFWKGGEPIWTTAENQGVNAAVHMWPGSEVPTVGPSKDFDRYNGSELLSSKVNRVMKWIDRENIDDRPELILTYVPTVDSFGHKFGISGQNLTDALTYVDDFIDLMQKEIGKRNLQNIVNTIIVSDHGMAPTSNDRLIYLDDLIDLEKLEHIDGWPLFGLRPIKKYSVEEIYNEIKLNIEKLGESETKKFDLYKVEELPKEWCFGGEEKEHKFNYRLAPIWLIPKIGYSITTHKQMKEKGFDYTPKGVHGYNNTELLMRAIFLGNGPYFDSRLGASKKVHPFKNTEVYNIICDTLNIIPSPNSGSDVNVFSKISGANELPNDWVDELEFPDLPFAVEHVVYNATYDLLWKKRPSDSKQVTISISTNNYPLQSMISEESTLSSLETQPIPKPTDFEEHPDSKGNLVDEVIDDIGEILDKVGNEMNKIFGDLFGSGDDKKGNKDDSESN
ncbi:phosphodiesterase; putative nucleotide pyrophosphatase precursor [Scheffersomyces stipitis CBS 6054]|uniref:Phosphodiesterase putative nucleotide pyrophosphatase n=1 Tax=Scheffersomyces stipitis (strain ATCC 58785 / CBS 6054 / NBRC 10063 / NRRL Y-11545) TaxID=322104 RepID=A3LS92_PICST|nr:phosphodiesterase; putative nucleotide pyrophosphatase precursor [Scheffersomyces stipitis CBS 6054]ABN65862.2 phosphodiesterase; putative nucleotide pyrophosphatase precursor [Scheffersomyces stipitis CBS 6054]